MKTALVLGAVAVVGYVLFAYRGKVADALSPPGAAAAPPTTKNLLPAEVTNLQAYCRGLAVADVASFRAHRPPACVGVTV
jgi:hypothetical protein